MMDEEKMLRYDVCARAYKIDYVHLLLGISHDFLRIETRNTGTWPQSLKIQYQAVLSGIASVYLRKNSGALDYLSRVKSPTNFHIHKGD
jgi:hypothetical protein